MELWLKLPDVVKALSLVCHRDSPLFRKVADETAVRLAPVARIFVDEQCLDARREFERIGLVAQELRPLAYAHLTGWQGEILDRIVRLFEEVPTAAGPATTESGLQDLAESAADDAIARRADAGGKPAGRRKAGK